MEHGPELVQMPGGSKVYTNRETNSMLNKQPTGGSEGTKTYSNNITISKIADSIIVREDADIDRIVNALVEKLKENKIAYGGV